MGIKRQIPFPEYEILSPPAYSVLTEGLAVITDVEITSGKISALNLCVPT